MTHDPEDPVNNPWDVSNSSSSTKDKTPSKKNTEEANPWHSSKNTQDSLQKDQFETFVEQLKKGATDFQAFKEKQKQRNGFNRGGNGSPGGGSIPPHVNSRSIFTILIAGAAISWMASGVFRVEETDQAAILRLGNFNRLVGPGLQYKLPYPFEKAFIKNVSSNNVMQSTDRLTLSARKNSDGSDQTLVLTGDENIIHISYTVTWKIKDLPAYLFTVRNPDSTILAATESIIREVVGQTDALSALTEERSSISQKASSMLQTVMDQYKIGVQIVQVQLQRVEPPKEVLDAFNDMQASLTDGDGLRIKAEAYQSEVVPKARGDAAKIIQEAEGYAQQVIARAKGEADRFTAVYTEYKKNPEVASKRLYINTLTDVLSNTQKTIVDQKAAPNMVPYLNLQPTNDKK